MVTRKTLTWAAVMALMGGCASHRGGWTPDREHPGHPEASAGRAANGSVFASAIGPAPAESGGEMNHDHPGHPGAGEPPPPSIGETPKQAAYVCSMHPEVVSDEPSRCPECGMKLVPTDKPHDHKDHQP